MGKTILYFDEGGGGGKENEESVKLVRSKLVMTEDLNFDKPHSSEIQLLSSNCQFFSHKILSFHLLPLPGKF